MYWDFMFEVGHRGIIIRWCLGTHSGVWMSILPRQILSLEEYNKYLIREREKIDRKLNAMKAMRGK